MNVPFQQWVEYIHGLPYFDRRIKLSRTVDPKQSRFLYKYKVVDPDDATSVDRLRDILINSRLWLSSPEDFNDPFDTSAIFSTKATGHERREYFKVMLKKRGVRYKAREKLTRELGKKTIPELDYIINSGYKDIINKMGVYSFAGDAKNILMWSHYAKDHTGVCIQFERARDYSAFVQALPIVYSSEYPEVNWIDNEQEKLEKVLLRKHKGWSYEEESRIVGFDHAHKYYNFDPQAVVRIIIGCKASMEIIDTVHQVLDERYRKGMPTIQVFYAHQHESRYQLLIRRNKKV